jgi:transposase
MSTKQKSLTELRIQAGELIEQGFDNDEIVEIVHCSLSSVKRWRKQVESQGSESLLPKSRLGRGSKLSDSQKEQLKTILLQGSRHFGYLSDLWTCKRIACASGRSSVSIIIRCRCHIFFAKLVSHRENRFDVRANTPPRRSKNGDVTNGLYKKGRVKTAGLLYFPTNPRFRSFPIFCETGLPSVSRVSLSKVKNAIR